MEKRSIKSLFSYKFAKNFLTTFSSTANPKLNKFDPAQALLDCLNESKNRFLPKEQINSMLTTKFSQNLKLDAHKI